MSRRSLPLSLALVLLTVTAAVPASATERSAPFALDQWIELKSTEGPVTLHRIRLVSQGGFTKSKIMRPGNAQHIADVQIQLEFSNESSDDWKARIRFEWVDAEGKLIDGYDSTEQLDSESRFEQQTVTLSTLKYGLEKAKQIRVEIAVARD